MSGYIDIHCHLDMCKDIEDLIKKARRNGVSAIVTNGVNKNSNRLSLFLSEKYEEVYASLGIYPIDALSMTNHDIDSEINFIRNNSKKITAIGEVGMDFKEINEKERQREIFEKFIRLSLETKKPIIVHSRKAELECIEILEKMRAKKVIMHCFCGKWKLVERIIKNNWFLTVPANVVFSQQFQNIAEKSELKNLFCETDSPYLHPFKLGENEPAFVIESYKKIAQLKKMKIGDIKERIYKNFEGLLNA